MKYLFRLIQKIPGINLVEYSEFAGTVYVHNPKVGSRTLLNALSIMRNGHGCKSERDFQALTKYMSRRKFIRFATGKRLVSLYRDPVERIESCWRQKIRDKDKNSFRLFNQYFIFYFPLLRASQDFESFVDAVCLIPDRFSEKHFQSQSYILMLDKVTYESLMSLSEIDKFSSKFFGCSGKAPPVNITRQGSASPDALNAKLTEKIKARYQADYRNFQKRVRHCN